MNSLHMVFVVLAAILLTGCHEAVTSQYKTRTEAEADQLFERGWLPSIVPPSARDIVTRNDLDLNTSSGEFSFDPKDLEGFTSKLTRLGQLDSGEYLGYSFDAWTFQVDPKRGHCLYQFSLR